MMKSGRYRILLLAVIVLGIIVLIPSSDLFGQCPMCRIGAETNLASGGTAGKGLNKGILLLLSLPYVLVGTFGFIWWRNKKKQIEDL